MTIHCPAAGRYSGDDASPNGGAGELLGRAYDSDVTVYPIYLDTSRKGGSFDRILSGYFPQKSNNRALAYERLTSLADETGGEIFGVSREEDLLEAYQRVASSLHHFSSLAYSPDKPKRNGEFRKVNVKIRREGRRRKRAAAITTDDRISTASGASLSDLLRRSPLAALIQEKMNTKSVATGCSSALLALLLFSVARAQDARLRLDHLDRLAARATESVEVTMNDVQVQFLRSSSRSANPSGRSSKDCCRS